MINSVAALVVVPLCKIHFVMDKLKTLKVDTLYIVFRIVKKSEGNSSLSRMIDYQIQFSMIHLFYLPLFFLFLNVIYSPSFLIICVGFLCSQATSSSLWTLLSLISYILYISHFNCNFLNVIFERG